MGTYNYASSSKQAGSHQIYDVDTYNKYGNTFLDPIPVPKAEDKNVIKKRPRNKNNLNEIDYKAQEHFIDICKQIGIDYEKLIQENFSDKCY